MFIEVLGLNVFAGKVDDIPYDIDKKTLINTMNPRVFTISRRDEFLKEAFENTDYLIEDGQYFTVAPLVMKGKHISKISGTKVFYHLMREANKNSGRVFLLGASEDTLAKMKERAAREYENLTVATYSPPFKEEFTEADDAEMIRAINEFAPDILFIGMTAPKQEKWGHKYKDTVNARIICAVGAVFDWYAEVTKQPEDVWVKLGLEWFIRTVRRPEILKRYPDYLMFFWFVFLNRVGLRKD